MTDLLTTSVTGAATALRNGGLVAFPTETVYGLGADADNDVAVERIFSVKGRPSEHPVIVHIADAEALDGWAQQVPDYARQLTASYWPGPLTVVLPRRADRGARVAGGAPTIGLRSPGHPMARALLSAFGGAVAAPSANRFGRVSPTTAEHVVAELGDWLDPSIDQILDGGPCDVGVESTIVDCTGPDPRLLRSGEVTIEAISATTGLAVRTADTGVRAPGTLAAHYAPQARVVVVDADDLDHVVRTFTDMKVGLLAPEAVADRPGVSRLAAPADAAQYARVLYATLRSADDRGLDVVLAVPPLDQGVGSAVRDRLRRAAHGSDTR